MWSSGRSPLEFFTGSNARRPEVYTLAEKPPLELGDVEILSRLNDEYAMLTAAVVPSVVSLDTAGVREEALTDMWGRSLTRRRMTQGQGSGVIVSEEGHVITNAHVISGQSKIQVTMNDGTSHAATLIGQDSMLDIAVLKIQAAGPFVPLKLGDSSQVKVGQMVFAVGNPFGLGETVTQGIISAKERSISDQQGDLFQTDAAINPGNSGGPLVNLQGEVIGINVAIFSPDKENPGFQGVGFSIPSNDARESLLQILDQGRPVHGFLGVKLWPLDARVRQSLNYDATYGSVVMEVVEDSPAARAGIQAGDVIVSYDGKMIETTDQLFRLVQRSRINQKAKLRIWRAGQEQDMEVAIEELGAMESQQNALNQAINPKNYEEIVLRLGMRVRSFSGIERMRGFQGALVSAISPSGIAAELFEIHDIIVAVNKREINSAEDFYRRIAESVTFGATQVTLLRDGEARTVTIPALSSK
jgi:serine protease Do